MNKKYISIFLTVGLLVIVGYGPLSNYPYLFTEYKFHMDRFTIYSDHPIDKNITVVLDSVRRNINCSELRCDIQWRIFLLNNKASYLFIANFSYASFAITQQFSNSIILASSDVKKDLAFRYGKLNNISRLHEIISHEATHVLINNYYGKVKATFIDTWKEEGYCEYIAKHSSFNIPNGLELFLRNGINHSNSYRYFKFRLYVSYLMDFKKMSFEHIKSSHFNLNDLEEEIRNNIHNSQYQPFSYPGFSKKTSSIRWKVKRMPQA